MIPFLLAIGERNCLDPITVSLPKPLLPVVNRPLIVYAVEFLAEQGHNDMVVGLCEMADQIESALGNGQRWNVQIQYLLQRHPGGIVDLLTRAASLLTETCLILPADLFVRFDSWAALDFHRAHDGPITALLSPTASAESYLSPLWLDRNHRIGREPSDGAVRCYDTGIYLIEPWLLNTLPECSFAAHSYRLLETLCESDLQIHGRIIEGYWNPIASFQDFQSIQQELLQGLMQESTVANDQSPIQQPLLGKHYIAEQTIGPGIWRGAGAWLHPTVQITPPVIIGAGCRVGRQVELGPNVVLGANCIIDEGATLHESTVLPETYIGKLLHVKQRVVQKQRLVDIESGSYVDITDPLLLNSVDITAVTTLILEVIERFIALAVLIIFLPLMTLLGVILWLSLGKIPVQRVERVGRQPTFTRISHTSQPEILNLYHFCSRNSYGSTNWFSGWIESWELYRLPELWNVVCGDLGLVGVMPLSRHDDAQVIEPWQKKRYDLQAGFTGLWYTEAFTPANFDEQCIVDTYHAATHSWHQTMRCLFQTPWAWVRRAYGVREKRLNGVQAREKLLYKYTQLIDIKIRETDA